MNNRKFEFYIPNNIQKILTKKNNTVKINFQKTNNDNYIINYDNIIKFMSCIYQENQIIDSNNLYQIMLSMKKYINYIFILNEVDHIKIFMMTVYEMIFTSKLFLDFNKKINLIEIVCKYSSDEIVKLVFDLYPCKDFTNFLCKCSDRKYKNSFLYILNEYENNFLENIHNIIGISPPFLSKYKKNKWYFNISDVLHYFLKKDDLELFTIFTETMIKITNFIKLNFTKSDLDTEDIFLERIISIHDYYDLMDELLYGSFYNGAVRITKKIFNDGGKNDSVDFISGKIIAGNYNYEITELILEEYNKKNIIDNSEYKYFINKLFQNSFKLEIKFTKLFVDFGADYHLYKHNLLKNAKKCKNLKLIEYLQKLSRV
ncbi:hypothetical protein QLL95_gp0116 [Cotonvirus japonicus]|uniref:Ankyrin repeat protein n=1 Tax=Cotonvirus japonicus TaxID=2811091 RepID=A0ABM7NR21_9VIRU|nr:hypothetical protein QLL95_gp0116 [Cotonvirus japonicus]BCS82605.1 hypothetical protein [Cotonvirus japonicus]